MGSFAAFIPAIVGGISTGIESISGAKQSGKEEAEFLRQAELEKLSAKDRSIERRRRLNKVLAGQIAETGARGIAFEGSPQAVARADVRQAELERLGGQVSDLERITKLKKQARGARKQRQRQQRVTTILTRGTGIPLLRGEPLIGKR